MFAIENLRKTFVAPGNVVVNAVDGINLSIDDGKLITLLGPSGCGKSTTLRMVGGFEFPDQGRIVIDGVDYTRVPPNKRNVNMVFQDYALFPHLSVSRNVGFGLELKAWRPGDIDARLLPDAVHQGFYIEADPLTPLAIDKIPERGIVLALDQITDPHNVGAIFRSASAFGVTAIVTTQRHSPDAHGALAKAATGALEHVPLVVVQNLGRGLEELKARGFMLVGLDSEGDGDL